MQVFFVSLVVDSAYYSSLRTSICKCMNQHTLTMQTPQVVFRYSSLFITRNVSSLKMKASVFFFVKSNIFKLALQGQILYLIYLFTIVKNFRRKQMQNLT